MGGAASTTLFLLGAARAAAPAVERLRSYRADFVQPARLSVDEAGRVAVTDPRAGAVVVRDAEGRVVLRLSGLDGPLGVAWAPGGGLLVGLAGSGEVVAVGEDGAVSARAAGFSLPADIEVLGDRVYVADATAGRVAVLDAADLGAVGEFEEGLAEPAGLAVGPSGELWVVDRGARTVLALDPEDGAVLRSFGEHGDAEGELYLPGGLAADAEGRLWVADSRLGRVTVFDAEGAFLAVVGRNGHGPGRLANPTDVALDPHGRLFVASSTDARLEVFGVDAFDDPEAWVPARVGAADDRLIEDGGSTVALVVEVPGYRPESLADVEANGVPADSLEPGDWNGDRVRDALATFDADAVAAAAGEEGVVLVTGRVEPEDGPALAFEEAVDLVVETAVADTGAAGGGVGGAGAGGGGGSGGTAAAAGAESGVGLVAGFVPGEQRGCGGCAGGGGGLAGLVLLPLAAARRRRRGEEGR